MKPITKVFLVIGVLLACLLVWAVFFGGDGVMAMVWNAIADNLNEIFGKITGSDTEIVPTWDGHEGTTLGDGTGGF